MVGSVRECNPAGQILTWCPVLLSYASANTSLPPVIKSRQRIAGVVESTAFVVLPTGQNSPQVLSLTTTLNSTRRFSEGPSNPFLRAAAPANNISPAIRPIACGSTATVEILG